ncbi:transporter substrate-binding domain-containing protein [Chitinibacter sp. SCUT-21]|uniref:substrate-binding periplasmic protein n=1 Tax=Chitinibacter sp. SCUT-21 TaxID=2970891 RepID=UPI0035A633C0
MPKKISLAFYEFGLLYHQDVGIDRDLVDELIKRSRCQFELSNLPRAQIWNELSSGQLMMSVSAIKTPEREVFSLFSAPYLRLKNMAVMQKHIADQNPDAARFLANSNLRWGVVKSYKHGAEQDELIEKLRAQERVIEAKDSAELFQMLSENKIQGLFAQATAYNFYARQLSFDKPLVARDWAPVDRGVEARLVYSKKHFSEADMAAWDQIIYQMQADGTIQKIIARYLPTPEVKRTLIPTVDQLNQKKTAN